MEIQIVKTIQSLISPFFSLVFEFFTLLGEETFFFILFLGLYWVYQKEFAIRFGFFYILNYVIVAFIKKIVNRPRPHMVSDEILDIRHSGGSSFPSAHTQNFAFKSSYIGLELLKKSQFSKKSKINLWTVIILLDIIVGLTRIYFGQHFLTDCLCGIALGISLSIIFRTLWKILPTKIKEIFVLDRFLILFSAVIFVFFMVNIYVHFVSTTYELIILYKFMGGIIGLTFGYLIDKNYIKSTYPINTKQVIAKLTMGYSIIFVCSWGLDMVFPENPMFIVGKYLLVSLVATTVVQWVFQLTFCRKK